ncbi:MAG: tetratricopeptide repeat protein [Planctomycetes bacterium]|nr:tetratricopeptide repeat protein [Planctomycetota bacterium]
MLHFVVTVVLAWSAWIPTESTDEARIAYVDGLDALRDGSFDAARAAFSRAIDQDSENLEYRLARGVTALFAEQPESAIKDLERAMQLSERSKESRLWRAAADRMQAQFFTETYPQSTNDPFESTVGDVCAFWGQTFRAVEQGYEPSAAEQAERRAKLADLRRWFVSRKLEVGNAVEVLWSRGRARCDRGEWAEAAADLDAAIARWPDDPTVLYYHAGVRLAVGDLETARRAYTRVLTSDTTFVNAYLGRALAAARMGDATRANADVAVIAKLAPDVAKTNEGAVAKALRDARVPSVFAAARRRYDETYQDGLRERESRVRERAQDAEARADVAAWLYEHIDVPRERVEPRGEPRLLRTQTQAQQNAELARAEQCCDEALALDATCVKALVVKAALRVWTMRYSDAETLLKRALDQAPTDADVLQLLSQVMDVAAAQKRALAAGLRTPTVVGSDRRIEGDYEVTTTWWRQPSQAELERARQLEAEADACLQRAVAALEIAAKAKAGTAQGAFIQGVLDRRFGRLEAARAAFTEATRKDPSYVEAWFQTAGVCSELGLGDAALFARAAGFDLIETTAAPHLTVAWRLLEVTKFDSARRVLADAERHDPADPRVAAFRGVALEADAKRSDAIREYTTALDLERARATTCGTSLDPGDTRPVATHLLGLAFTLRRKLAALALEEGDTATALTHLNASVALEARLVRGQGVDDLPRALLPTPGQEPGIVPESLPVLAHIAWARVKVGEVLLQTGRHQQARAAVQPVFAYGPSMINGKGSDRFREQEMYAKVLLCRIALAEGNIEEARMLAMALPRKRHGVGPSKSPYPELEIIGQELGDEVDRKWREMQERGDERWDLQGAPNPDKAEPIVRRILDDSGLTAFANGDSRASNVAAPFAALVMQSVLVITLPKSNQWREEVRVMVQQVMAERDRTAEAIAQFEQADPRFARRDDADLYKRLLVCQDKALELLRAACVEQGYPAADLSNDLGSKTGPPGPAPFTGDAKDPEAHIADACARAGLPYMRRTDRYSAAPESMASWSVRQGIEAIDGPKTAQWRSEVAAALMPLAQQARQSQQQQKSIDSRIADLQTRLQQQPKSARGVEKQIKQLKEQRAAAEATEKLHSKALEVLKAEAEKAGYPRAELEADLNNTSRYR